MESLDTLAQLVRWAGSNTAYNLAFIPADRLDWKPEPSASSALEIINHLGVALRSMLPALAGGDWTLAQFERATNLEEAQALVKAATEEYAAALARVKPDDLARTINHRRGPIPLSFAARMPVIDALHHHGQIAYIQTLLGDTESHFQPR